MSGVLRGTGDLQRVLVHLLVFQFVGMSRAVHRCYANAIALLVVGDLDDAVRDESDFLCVSFVLFLVHLLLALSLRVGLALSLFC